MKITIEQSVLNKFPELRLGVVVARGISNTAEVSDVQQELRAIERTIREQFTVESLVMDPRIDVWRKAYAAFGAKPKEHRSSIENLCRLILKGGEMRHINALVDIYNVISLKYCVPVGGEDLNTMQGDLKLTCAGELEAPVALLGDPTPRPPHPGEVIYKDDISAVCRRWNWREADRTKLTEATKNAVLVIEGLPPVTLDLIRDASVELAERVQACCGGTVTNAILDAQYPSLEL